MKIRSVLNTGGSKVGSMSAEDRGRREVRRLDYKRLHSVGTTEEVWDTESEVDREVMGLDLESGLHSDEGQYTLNTVTEWSGGVILVRETPFNVENSEVKLIRSSVETIPEMQAMGGDPDHDLLVGEACMTTLSPRTVDASTGVNATNNKCECVTEQGTDPQYKRFKVADGKSPAEGVISAGLSPNPGKQQVEPKEGAMTTLQQEIDEATLQERNEAANRESEELEKKVGLLTEQMAVEAKERRIKLMKQKTEELTEARKKSLESGTVLNPELLGSDETARNMFKMLEMLRKEEQERKQRAEETFILELENEQARRREEEERLQREQEQKREEERKRKEEEEKKAKEEEEEKLTVDVKTMGKVAEWIDGQDRQQKEEETNRDRLKALQIQIEEMNKPENRRQCQVTGVEMFTSLDALQIEGHQGVDLAAKAHAAMLAAAATKRKTEEGEDSEGELIQSKLSNGSKVKGQKIRSGLTALPSHKVKFEVEWAHHWLGKEFEANPVSFNQMKLGQYVSGEAAILLHCEHPGELRARLKLMHKLGYWAAKSDWPLAHSIYVTILRGIQTGRETWSFDPREYASDMLAMGSRQVIPKEKEEPGDPGTFIFVQLSRGESVTLMPHM